MMCQTRLMITVLVVVLFLTGCASSGARSLHEASVNENNAWWAKVNDCYGRIERGDEYKAKWAPYVENRIEAFMDESFISEQLVKHFMDEEKQKASCRALFVTGPIPQINNINQRELNSYMDIAVTLLKREMTWGEFFKKNKDDTARFQSEREKIYSQVDSNFHQAITEESRQNAANAAAMHQAMMINTLNIAAQPKLELQRNFRCTPRKVGFGFEFDCR